MNRYPVQKPPRWWPPKLSRGWIRFWRPVRKWQQVRSQRLLDVEVRGAEHVRQSLEANHGVLITPNHSSHADCYALYGAADRIGTLFYIMVAWQVFQRGTRLRRRALQHHGCFSVDRDASDVQAFRRAIEVLQSAPHPLVVFPEGEVYHLNERITPFREGPAAMALLAARKGSRPIVCIPAAMRYRYVQDPTPELLPVMERLERAISWRPRPDLSLAARIYHFAEAAISLKEIEFLGHASSGPLPKRVADLMDFILDRIEASYGLDFAGATVPERVKGVRAHLIKRREELPENSPDCHQCEEDLEDVFVVVKLFSYPGDYVAQQPSIERIAETLDKFEEDGLGAATAAIRGARKVAVTFGEPIPVASERGKNAAAALTRLLEERVQALLSETESRSAPTPGEAAAG